MTQPSSLITHHLSSSGLLSELVKDILSKDAECRLEAKGHSMSPFIKDGDVVTLSPLFDYLPGVGDVVAFIRPETGNLVIHRVIWEKGDSYLVSGGDASCVEGPIKKGSILGRVTKVERKGKKVLIGLGPERFLITFLARKGLLFPLLIPMWRLIRPFAKIFLLAFR